MKHLNLKIALLAFGLLLAINQSNANESVLSSTNSSVDKFIYLAKADNNERKKVRLQDEEEDRGKWWTDKCSLDDDEKLEGKICEASGECVKNRKACKESSPS